MSQDIAHNNLLTGVIATPRGGRIEAGRFRRYRSAINTSATIKGVVDTRVTSILYEVGRAVDSIEDALRPDTGGAATAVVGSYPTAAVLAEDFLGMARKYSNFSASFEYSSLGGVVERLAKGLAACSVFDGVSSNHLAGGRSINVTALGTHSTPVNSLVQSVFIPRLVSGVVSPDVFGVITAAVAGEGSNVVTDVLGLDGNNVPIVPTCASAGLPLAIIDALRLLGANMIACDQGPLFALCVTRGLHSVLSVVGHSDEGGITRDALRASHFAQPFGGIHYGLTAYTGLPTLSSIQAASVAAYVDSIVLCTAALTTHADPGVSLRGQWFPVFLNGTSASDKIVEPGETTDPTDLMAENNRLQYLNVLPRWSGDYVRGLGILFAAAGDSSLASVVLCTAAGRIVPRPRHLRYPTVAPFFWIEPTSLLPPHLLGTPSEEEGAASLCGRDCATTRPAWEDAQAWGDVNGFAGSFALKFKGARYAPFLHHWLGHERNGLGAVRIRQLDPSQVVLPGPCSGNELVRERVLSNQPLSSLLWVRGQSPFPAPAEALNLGGTIGVWVKFCSMDDDGTVSVEHVPGQWEFAGASVTMRAARPAGLNSAGSNSPGPQVRRARTRAAMELTATRLRVEAFGVPDSAAMITALSGPVLGSAPEARVVRDTASGGEPRSGSLLPAPSDPGPVNIGGSPLSATMQHAPQRAPRAPILGGGLLGLPGGGGRAALPPPPAPDRPRSSASVVSVAVADPRPPAAADATHPTADPPAFAPSATVEPAPVATSAAGPLMPGPVAH